MIVYGIRDKLTGDWWSRNHWGTPTSIPDLYTTRKKAEYQTEGNGKLACHRRFYAGAIWMPRRDPEIVELNLNER